MFCLVPVLLFYVNIGQMFVLSSSVYSGTSMLIGIILFKKKHLLTIMPFPWSGWCAHYLRHSQFIPVLFTLFCYYDSLLNYLIYRGVQDLFPLLAIFFLLTLLTSSTCATYPIHSIIPFSLAYISHSKFNHSWFYHKYASGMRLHCKS